MKRSDFYNVISEACKGQSSTKEFDLVYKKKDGSIRNAHGKMSDSSVPVKGTGESRDQKVKNHDLFQYYDMNSKAYRSAKISNILEVTIDGTTEKVED